MSGCDDRFATAEAVLDVVCRLRMLGFLRDFIVRGLMKAGVEGRDSLSISGEET
jgi:hypothetical protein